MIVIHPDATWRIKLPGLPGPVRKPVDVNEAITGFHTLRTLRVYHFEQDSVIEGHAEEDEVYLVLLSGSVELTIRTSEHEEVSTSGKLSAPASMETVPCAAYLPPGASYKLVAKTDADVAYARAASARAGSPKILLSRPLGEACGANVVMESDDHAEWLRFRLISIQAQTDPLSFAPFRDLESRMERFIHVRSISLTDATLASATIGAETIELSSGDTVAFAPGDQPYIQLARGSLGLALILMA